MQIDNQATTETVSDSVTIYVTEVHSRNVSKQVHRVHLHVAGVLVMALSSDCFIVICGRDGMYFDLRIKVPEQPTMGVISDKDLTAYDSLAEKACCVDFSLNEDNFVCEVIVRNSAGKDIGDTKNHPVSSDLNIDFSVKDQLKVGNVRPKTTVKVVGISDFLSIEDLVKVINILGVI